MLIPKLYFDDSLSNFFEGDSTKMKCDIYEKENKYYVEMDLPGFKKDEIKIECNKGNLVISAEKCEKDDEEDNERNYLRRERVYNKRYAYILHILVFLTIGLGIERIRNLKKPTTR